MTVESVAASHAPVASVSSDSAEDPGDSSYGWALFYIFMAAVLAISFAVCVLAMAPSWWMLGIVYATDVAITGLVFKVVLGAFSSPAYTDLEDAESAPRHA